ncbi:MAG: class I SAM-dependent methyltransferase [Candidatus Cloacimonadales bacterium]
MMMDWDGFAEYYDWEFQQACSRQKTDIDLWNRLASEYGSPVLEICCGSGRITLNLAEQGAEIYALDYSQKLLEILRAKQKNHHKIKTFQADMRNFQIDKKFPFAFISYSSFQQLLSLQDQIDCLQTIHQHLLPDGILALDLTPSLCEGADKSPETLQYSLPHPARKSQIKLYSAYQIDRLNNIKHYHDRYLEIFGDKQIKEFSHSISLKDCPPDYMKLLLDKCGFDLLDIQGGFQEEILDENSHNAIYLARRK